jgi:hypothetical protein
MVKQFVLGMPAFMAGIAPKHPTQSRRLPCGLLTNRRSGGEHIDHKGDVDKPPPHRTICEVAELSPGRKCLHFCKGKVYSAQVYVIYRSLKAFFILKDTLFSRQGSALSGMVVLGFLPRMTSSMPILLIKRATVQRAISKPSLRIWRQISRTRRR